MSSRRRLGTYSVEEIEDLFINGDRRYFDNSSLRSLLSFIKGDALIIEEVKIPQGLNYANSPVTGPQQELKRLTLVLFELLGIELLGFERRVAHGIADVLGNRGKQRIIVECGPCRIDKGFNYLRDPRNELWLIREETNLQLETRPQLFIVRRGSKWEETLRKHDQEKLQQFQRVRSPLDTL